MEQPHHLPHSSAWRLLLEQQQSVDDTPLVCKLLCVSKSMAALVHSTCSGGSIWVCGAGCVALVCGVWFSFPTAELAQCVLSHAVLICTHALLTVCMLYVCMPACAVIAGRLSVVIKQHLGSRAAEHQTTTAVLSSWPDRLASARWLAKHLRLLHSYTYEAPYFSNTEGAMAVAFEAAAGRGRTTTRQAAAAAARFAAVTAAAARLPSLQHQPQKPAQHQQLRDAPAAAQAHF